MNSGRLCANTFRQAGRKCAADLVVTGPEAPLVLGLADALKEAGIACFGPCAFAAQLEGSKAFAKNMMRKTGVPTAAFTVFNRYEEALGHVRTHPLPMVVKADGLAAGKGVVIAQTREEAENALKEISPGHARSL